MALTPKLIQLQYSKTSRFEKPSSGITFLHFNHTRSRYNLNKVNKVMTGPKKDKGMMSLKVCTVNKQY